MNKQIKAFCGGMLIIILFTHCAVNMKVSYNTIKTDIPSNTELTYSIATHDQRIEVLDKSRDEKMVGYFRSGTAIAYPLGTASGQNFSDDFSDVIKNSLGKSAANAQIIKTNFTDTKQNILSKLIETKNDRLLLITVKVWRTDSKPDGMVYYGTEVIWNLSLDVFDNKGNLIGSNHTEGFEPNTEKQMSGSIEKIQKIVNVKFKEKLDLLFNNPEIKKCLITK
jgi:hypothetical protein